MEIETHEVVVTDFLDRVDDDLVEVARFTGVAVTYIVLSTVSMHDTMLYVVPDYSGPRGRYTRPTHIWAVTPTAAPDGARREILLALGNAAYLAAAGIAQAEAMQSVLVESTP